MSRDVQAGSQIRLRAQFLDDQGDTTVPSGVSIFLFEPDTDTSDLSSATISGEPTYLGNGIEEYLYSTNENTVPGEWTDRWIGTINGQLLDQLFNFTVTNSGEIIDLPDQLFANNIVDVTIASGIRGLDGSVMTEEYSFQFLTTTSPSYSEVRKIKLEYGGYIPDIQNDTIQLAILEASLEADELVFSKDSKNKKFLNHAKREWVTCKTALTLINNLNNQIIKSKSLGDFSVSYDTNTLRDAMAKAWECLDKWEPQLLAGGYAKASQQPSRVVKGSRDPDRPQIGRIWSDPFGFNTDAGLPAVNTKDKATTQRRYKGIFSTRKEYW